MKRSAKMALALTVLAACSSTTSQQGATTQTSAATTLPPATTTPSTETITPATTVPLESGWAAIDQATLSGRQLSPPCCGSDWLGQPSPALPADGGPFLDGDYSVRMEWPDDPTQPLELHLYRFESCSVLPEGTCENPTDPAALGIDVTNSVAVTVPLDVNVAVVLVGFAGFDTTEDNAAQGTGVDLGELAAAVETAYDQVFKARLEAGEAADAIVADVRANPVGGFGPAEDGSGMSVEFVANDAPPLLFQGLYEYTEPPTPIRGTDVLRITSVGVVGGQLTLYVYAGFYS